MTEASSQSQIEMAADIVSAYVSKNSIPPSDLPALIDAVHKALGAITTGKRGGEGEPAPELKPAVPIKKSVTDDFLICLEDGKRFKSLRRHLSTTYNMTPEAYREKWNLPKDYPMVAPSYAAVRSNLAKAAGLGNRKTEAAPEPVKDAAPELAEPEPTAPEATVAATAAPDHNAPEPAAGEEKKAAKAPRAARAAPKPKDAKKVSKVEAKAADKADEAA